MYDISLVLPLSVHRAAAEEYVAEHIENGETEMHGDGGLDHMEDYAEWLVQEERNHFEDTVAPGLVPGATYFAIRKSDGRLVGTVSLRFKLNDYLLSYGGHIGYGVRPSERQKGYATQMLQITLKECKKHGITRALVTCYKGNTASARTIIKCGGILENEVEHRENILQRYWIGVK